jgi:hypothetical protein
MLTQSHRRVPYLPVQMKTKIEFEVASTQYLVTKMVQDAKIRIIAE